MTTRESWVLLVVLVAGFAAGTVLGMLVGLRDLALLLPPAGAAIAYFTWRLWRERGGFGPRRRRGQLKYWRGRAFYDEDE